MKIWELNKNMPINGAIIEVNASTKKKNAWLKIYIPDELANHILAQMMGKQTSMSNLVIAYHDSDAPKNELPRGK